MRHLIGLIFAAVAVGCTAKDALAQDPRLEDAWGVCATVARAGDPDVALASAATTAGFPLLEQGVYGIGSAGQRALDISITRPLAGVVHCRVRNNGGSEADLVARATRFWSARQFVASDRPSTVYAAIENYLYTSVSLRPRDPGLWELNVEWDAR